MYKTIVLVFVCLCCFLTSCRTSRQESQKNTSTTQSLIVQKESYRDTVLFTPKAETSLKIPVTELVFKQGLNDVSRSKTFTQKNGNATAQVKIRHDTIFVIATCDSIALRAKIKQELNKEISATARSNTENKASKTGYTLLDLIVWSLVAFILGFVTCYILKKFRIVL